MMAMLEQRGRNEERFMNKAGYLQRLSELLQISYQQLKDTNGRSPFGSEHLQGYMEAGLVSGVVTKEDLEINALTFCLTIRLIEANKSMNSINEAKEMCDSIADYLEKDRKENPEKYRSDPDEDRKPCLTILMREKYEEEQRALKGSSD